MSVKHFKRILAILLLALVCVLLFVAYITRLEYPYSIEQIKLHVSRFDAQIADSSSNSDLVNVQDKETYQRDACLRYAFTLCPAKAGLGHKMVCIMLGHRYALENNATLVINKDILIGDAEGTDHGQYPWAVDFFGFGPVLHQGDIDTSFLSVIWEDTWHARFDAAPECNVFFQTSDFSCSDYRRETGFVGKTDPEARWCYKKWLWILPTTRDYLMDLRAKHGSTTRLNDILRDAREAGLVDVVWHVRYQEGDATLLINTRKEFIDNMMNMMKTLFRGYGIRLFVVSQTDTSDLDFQPWFQAYDAVFLPSLDVQETMELMIDSSVLVTSGSAFSITASLYKSYESLSFQVVPKGQDHVGDLFQHPIVDDSGRVVYPADLNAMNSRVDAILSTISSQSRAIID
jgi:hypothetical protein